MNMASEGFLERSIAIGTLLVLFSLISIIALTPALSNYIHYNVFYLEDYRTQTVLGIMGSVASVMVNCLYVKGLWSVSHKYAKVYTAITVLAIVLLLLIVFWGSSQQGYA